MDNDKQVDLKGSRSFMCEADRLRIVGALRGVDRAILSIDKGLDVCDTLRMCYREAQREPGYYSSVVFANGGDRTADEIPEISICEELDIEMVFGVGGGKVESSSELLERVKHG